MAKPIDKIVLPVSFESKPAQDIPLIAFLFSRSGKLLDKMPVQKEAVEFKTYNKSPKELRLFIAPAANKKIEDVTTISALEKFKPYEAVISFNVKGEVTTLPIPDYFTKLWHLRTCRIRGRVIKNFSIGNISQYRGICNARVHICEVDRIWWWINKIPDAIILKIPEIVINPKWPIPIPEPGPDPGPILSELNPQPLPPRSFPTIDLQNRFRKFTADSEFASLQSFSDSTANEFTTTASAAAIGERLQQPQVSFQSLPEIRKQLLSGNVSIIRKTIVDYYHLFHPYLCYIPWIWPYFYRCDEIDVVYTDLNGYFDTTFWYWYDGDDPDIYFWVEYLIDGVWTTVYKPSIACNTYWNYTCGSEITIRVTDPRVRWECNDVLEGDIIWIKTIGNNASVVHIQQTDLFSVIQGKNFNRIGLSDVSVWASPNAVGDFRRPFGSWLPFVVQFGSGLPSNSMYYYRWAYRKTRNADLSVVPITTPLSLHKGQTLYKSYTYEYFDMFLHKHIGVNSFKLGPYSKNGNDDLFIIPPAYPASAPVNAPELSPLWDQNTVTIQFDSSQLSDGLYEFFLELFDFNGNKLAAIPKHLFQIPDYNTFAPSVNAPDQYLVLNGPVNADAYKMNVRIDNNACQANIYKIKVNGSEVTTDCCGFVPYPPNANVEVSFRAYHPHNFATFTFTVQKGTCNDPAQSSLTNANGMVIGNAGVYNRDNASIFRHNFTPAELLGICTSEGKAAFAEYLYITVLTTNGSNQLFFLDDSALAAFALEPA
jgi:hypothetical protein